MVSFEVQPADVYDVIGLGFGPANLAAAGALLEQPREVRQSDVPVPYLELIGIGHPRPARYP